MRLTALNNVIATTIYKVDCYAQDIVIIAALVNLQCASTTIYKVDFYAQNIVITAALVNLQCARLPVAICSTCTPDDGWDCHPKHVE